ncbi:hypothetical protein [Paraburkholderia sp. GAS82]|uniref:hypothetical protein n=1 Tax=Paraburkholderia sp. GAS82 TaxID=3035137 RepID=UPI003D23697A
MPKLNPNHPVTQLMDDEFMHKLCAVLVMKLGGRAEITIADFHALGTYMGNSAPVLVTHAHPESIELRLVDQREAESLAREHGGLPI